MTENPINTYEQVPKGGVFISACYLPDGWAVYRHGFDIDPTPKDKRAWYDPRGANVFSAYNHDGKLGALRAAQQWAGERYGIAKWRRNGQGDYIDANAGYAPLRCEVEAKAARAAKKAGGAS